MTPAQQLGPYRLIERIGRGGMGEVWKARDTRLDREVAIKISAEQFSDRFEREAKAIAALNHPNICTLHDVGPNYLVMELIDGPTLADRIAEGPIPLEESLAISKQIADALEAAHEKNIVHRDLKPGNIKLRADGSVKVLDFGLAKAGVVEAVTHDSPTLLHSPTQIGVILGTAAYMAPEQARGKTVDKRADIWSFGIVLHGIRMNPGVARSPVLPRPWYADPGFEQRWRNPPMAY
jgi:serine/threonine-protein kinase